MPQSEKSLQKSGKDINCLKHFIYLDRARVNSYSSQLLDGIVQVRRLTENEGNRIHQSSDEEYTDEVQEDGKEAEISLGPKNYAGGMSGKTIDKSTKRKGFKKGQNAETNDYSTSFSEDKTNHDNEYLIFEDELIKKGLLKEINKESEIENFPSLIKITGTSRFIDWDSVLNLFRNPEISKIMWGGGRGFSENNKTKEQKKQMSVGLEVFKNFSFGSITIHTKIGASILVGSIDPSNLCMTRDQLRLAYITPGDVELTVVGFVPKRKVEAEPTIFPGIAGEVNIAELSKHLTGEFDIAIDPIAVYTEISLA